MPRAAYPLLKAGQDRAQKRGVSPACLCQLRADDNPETFKVRLDAYNRDTAPLLPYYSAQGKLTEVNGMADIETVAAFIAEVLDRQASPKGEPKPGFFARLFGRK